MQAAAEKLGKEYSESSPVEESRGIDGHLDGQAVSVKPSTYQSTTPSQVEMIDARMIYYETQNKRFGNGLASEVTVVPSIRQFWGDYAPG